MVVKSAGSSASERTGYYLLAINSGVADTLFLVVEQADPQHTESIVANDCHCESDDEPWYWPARNRDAQVRALYRTGSETVSRRRRMH
jgi:hypothetical protein